MFVTSYTREDHKCWNRDFAEVSFFHCLTRKTRLHKVLWEKVIWKYQNNLIYRNPLPGKLSENLNQENTKECESVSLEREVISRVWNRIQKTGNVKLLSFSTNFQATNFLADFYSEYSVYKPKKCLQLSLQKLDEKSLLLLLLPVFTVYHSLCDFLKVFCWELFLMTSG